jgi:hypothetical protein
MKTINRHFLNGLAQPSFFLALSGSIWAYGRFFNLGLQSRALEYASQSGLPSVQAQKLILFVDYARFKFAEDQQLVVELFFACLALSLLRWQISRPHQSVTTASDGLLPFLYFVILNAATTNYSNLALLHVQRTIDKYYQNQFGLSFEQARKLSEDLVFIQSQSLVAASNGIGYFLVFGLLFTAARWLWLAKKSTATA